jgi:hypothetical protein
MPARADADALRAEMIGAATLQVACRESANVSSRAITNAHLSISIPGENALCEQSEDD